MIQVSHGTFKKSLYNVLGYKGFGPKFNDVALKCIDDISSILVKNPNATGYGLADNCIWQVLTARAVASQRDIIAESVRESILSPVPREMFPPESATSLINRPASSLRKLAGSGFHWVGVALLEALCKEYATSTEHLITPKQLTLGTPFGGRCDHILTGSGPGSVIIEYKRRLGYDYQRDLAKYGKDIPIILVTLGFKYDVNTKKIADADNYSRSAIVVVNPCDIPGAVGWDILRNELFDDQHIRTNTTR